MKNPDKNKWMTLGAIALVVVMVGALALTLNGSSLQGYLNLRKSPPADGKGQVPPPELKGADGKGGIPIKPFTIEPKPKPQSPEPVPANQVINRAELAKLIVTATGVPINTAGGPHFPDVSPTDWYYTYVETAANNFWMMGYPDGTFKPANTVNRAEGAKILSSSVLAKCTSPSSYFVYPYYIDVPSGVWFYDYVIKMADCKMVDVLPSKASYYYPAYLLSRGRAQYMIDNAKKAGWIK